MSFLTDSKGNKSSARLNVAIWSLGVFVVWFGMCIYKRDLLDIPVGVGAIVAYVVGGKTLQSFAEKKDD
jgi:hypothetical protein